MPEVVVLMLAASGTALATGLGAVPVFLLGRRAPALAAPLLGFAAGAMTVAAFTGLLIPAAEEGSALGSSPDSRPASPSSSSPARSCRPSTASSAARGPDASASALVFLVLFVHSLPEGLAVGTAFASDRAGLSLFVILAIAIQNVPEGTSIALPMHDAGFGPWRQFWVAVATSAAAADRRRHRLARGRGGRRPAAALLRLRRRRDADDRRDRDGSAGLWRRAASARRCSAALAGAATMVALSLALGV